MKDLWNFLKEEYGKGRPIVLYGTGDGADKICARLDADGIYASAVFASSGFVRDRYFRDMKVESFDSVMSRLNNPIVLVCFGSSRPDVIALIDEVASAAETYAPDVPVCGGEVFDAKFYEEHKAELDKVTSILEDEESQRCMENIIQGRLTGDIKYLHKAECTPEDIYSLIELPEDSVFYDLGAYTGDTVKEFTSRFPSINHIVAVEPEPRNHRKLAETAKVFSDMILYRALISDSCRDTFITASARGRGTRGNPVNAKTIATPAITVDHIMEETGLIPNLIKFDIEGFELEGIRGAAKTVREHRPILKIACYHKSGDIFSVPQEVLAIRSDYKVYMRHLPSVPGWDTDFIFV